MEGESLSNKDSVGKSHGVFVTSWVGVRKAGLGEEEGEGIKAVGVIERLGGEEGEENKLKEVVA